ncbi:MAG: hypothetical protein ACWA41_12815 [Putridiphycobacter sp.]
MYINRIEKDVEFVLNNIEINTYPYLWFVKNIDTIEILMEKLKYNNKRVALFNGKLKSTFLIKNQLYNKSISEKKVKEFLEAYNYSIENNNCLSLVDSIIIYVMKNLPIQDFMFVNLTGLSIESITILVNVVLNSIDNSSQANVFFLFDDKVNWKFESSLIQIDKKITKINLLEMIKNEKVN